IDLPFPDATFDAVMANFVLSHFTRYETALFEMARVLRRGGRMGATAWASQEDEFTRVWREVAESFVGKDMLRDAVRRGCPWEERFADPRGLRDALRGAGIRPVEVEHREYRFTTTLEDHLAGRETGAIARFMRQMLGEALWERFRQRVREEFAGRFPDRIGDTRDVLIATGPKR
ncbi:MAG: methyltransferase domain-containing protein, partial [Actinomycetota bacterium]|nr:methyltransferase domain-containing protein [Actinomycetota bacterium]